MRSFSLSHLIHFPPSRLSVCESDCLTEFSARNTLPLDYFFETDLDFFSRSSSPVFVKNMKRRRLRDPLSCFLTSCLDSLLSFLFLLCMMIPSLQLHVHLTYFLLLLTPKRNVSLSLLLSLHHYLSIKTELMCPELHDYSFLKREESTWQQKRITSIQV